MNPTPRRTIVLLISRDFGRIGDGGSVMSASLASALAALGTLHIVDMNRHPFSERHYAQGEALPLPFGGRAHFHASVEREDGAKGLSAKLKTLRRKVLRQSRRFRRRQALAITQALSPHVVVADDLTGCQVARDSAAPCRVVHTHNLESALHTTLANETGKGRFHRKARQYARWEREVLPAVEQVWAVSEADAAHYRSLGVKDARVLRIAFPDDRFEAEPRPGTQGVAVFFGSLWYGPNAEAARYLVTLAPKLRAAMPGAVIRVIGGRPGAALEAALAVPGIEYLGYVDDLRAAVADAALILVPLAWGGGTKIKTAEALALGKPVLSTTEGIRGLDVQDGEELLVRERGAAFEEACLAVLRDPAAHAAMAARGQAYARAHFSQAALLQAVRAALPA